MHVKTTDSKQVWQSPDGQKTIWEVKLKAGDQEYGLKTYSSAVATLGFEGDIESYVNQRGDRFVRQVVKKEALDGRDSSIRAQWAIGQAIALASATMDKKAITMPVIEKYAKELFTAVSRVKGEKLTSDMLARAESYIHSYTQPQGA
ncbi:MAG TPA: hypothetical protein VJ836_02440 [Candidatus Saccharimonadales bacterium]|nr:hypothetical protein [Candidatus Saccharimonadales bacterium]